MPFPSCVPRLSDALVALRAHDARDVERIVEMCTDPESQRWTTVPAPYATADAHQFLAAVAQEWSKPDDLRYWAISAANDPTETLLGPIDLRPRGGGLAEIGFMLHPEARGRGLMTAAVRLAVQWWFQEAGGRRVTWRAFAGNLPSWGVVQAVGFRFDTVTHLSTALRTGELSDEWHGAIDLDDPTPPTRPTVAVLAQESIRLRPWREADVAASEPADHLPHFLPARAVPTPTTFDAWWRRRQEQLASGGGLSWCIADRGSDRALGGLTIFVRGGELAEADTAELGYYLFPSARGRGVAKAAAAMALAHAFSPTTEDGLGLRRLVAETASDNAASNAILAALGFTRWGHESDATAPDGSVSGADHWSATNPSR